MSQITNSITTKTRAVQRWALQDGKRYTCKVIMIT